MRGEESQGKKTEQGQQALPLQEHYMRRALALAQRGLGHTSPNPMVGCVIVKDGRVIGESTYRYIQNRGRANG